MTFKQVVLLPSCQHLRSLSGSSTAQNQTPYSPPGTRPVKSRRQRLKRGFATVHGHDALPLQDPLNWPVISNPHKPPTPYQIFNQKRGEVYSKQRFYELVKLYHPDRNGLSTHSKCSVAEMLERYRLVIAANAILCDPAKRKAYDEWGFGWDNQDGNDPATADVHPVYNYSSRHRWRSSGSGVWHWPADQDPMYNATWEDWERWYHSTRYPQSRTRTSASWTSSFFSPRAHRRTVYVNNYTFMSLVFLLAALGGVGQATRANNFSKTRLERSQLVNDETSKVLMAARRDSLDNAEDGETKHGRIRRFMRDKEAYSEGEFDGRVLDKGDDGMCASEAVKTRNEKRFWELPPENR